MGSPNPRRPGSRAIHQLDYGFCPDEPVSRPSYPKGERRGGRASRMTMVQRFSPIPTRSRVESSIAVPCLPGEV